jgi:aryl carrier-like protein
MGDCKHGTLSSTACEECGMKLPDILDQLDIEILRTKSELAQAQVQLKERWPRLRGEIARLQAQNKLLLDALDTIRSHTLAWCRHNGQTECREWMRKVAAKAWEEVQDARSKSNA